MTPRHLFPSVIYTDTIRNEHLLRNMLQFVSKIPADQQNKNIHSVRNGWQSNIDLQTATEFTVFAAHVLDRVRAEILPPKFTPAISEMWVNVHAQHGFNHNHVHANSWYSGILYLQCPVNSGKICFTDPRPGAEMMNTHESMCITPGAGTLLLFPGFLPHYVEPNLNTTPRISLSFNLFVRDA